MAEHLIAVEEAQTNLVACAAFLAENIKSSEGHAQAMKEIIPRYLEQNSVDLAAEFANSVDDPFTRDRLLTLVAEKCAEINDDEYAFQLIDAIEDVGMRAQAQEHIALQKSAKGDFAKAFTIADTLDHSEYVLADIAVRQSETGDNAAATAMLERIEFPNAKVLALENIARNELKQGENDKATQTLQQATEAAEEIEFLEEKINAQMEIGNSLIEIGRKDLAIGILDKAKSTAESIDGAHRDQLLANLAVCFLEAGSIELADRTLDLVEDKTKIAQTLHGFSEEFRDKGEIVEADETLEEAYQILKSQRDREVTSSRERYRLWNHIAVGFAEAGKGERAVEIALEILQETEQTGALAQIAQICIRHGKDNFARQAINAISNDAQKMFALIGMSDAALKTEKTDEALNYLREAETLSETVPQLASRSTALNELATRFHNLGDAAKARELMQENVEIIATIRDESSRAVALVQLGDLYNRMSVELNESEREIVNRLVNQANN